MKFRRIASMLALALPTMVAGQVGAATVTDQISFTDIGIYGVGGSSWNGTATASGSFTITFDPTKLYLDQSLTGKISNLTFSVNDSCLRPSTVTLNSIASFSYAYGTLDLFSGSANQFGMPNKNLNGTPNIVIGINGWGDVAAADVWYSQTGFHDTLTTSGS